MLPSTIAATPVKFAYKTYRISDTLHAFFFPFKEKETMEELEQRLAAFGVRKGLCLKVGSCLNLSTLFTKHRSSGEVCCPDLVCCKPNKDGSIHARSLHISTPQIFDTASRFSPKYRAFVEITTQK